MNHLKKDFLKNAETLIKSQRNSRLESQQVKMIIIII